MGTTKPQKFETASRELSRAVGKEVKFTQHGFDRLVGRFSGVFSDPYVYAVREAIKLLDVMIFKKKIRLERSKVLVVVARAQMGKGYVIVTSWDPRFEK